MEAFGQLTGGIAHDFNNLLTIVLGNLEFLEPRLAGEEERALLHRAADAAQMGARLTSRLLSFARRRRLAPEILNLNDLVLGLAELLKRSLGEQITLTTVLAGALWPTRADPSEVENAVLNLAINARDAMPHGGKLVIETRNMTIDRERRSRAGAPRGRLRAHLGDRHRNRHGRRDAEAGVRAVLLPPRRVAAPGSDSARFMALPGSRAGMLPSRARRGRAPRSASICRARRTAPAPKASEAAPSVPLSENCETVLVVEDDPKLRELTLQRIEGLGYVVLEAADAAAAIAILERETGYCARLQRHRARAAECRASSWGAGCAPTSPTSRCC